LTAEEATLLLFGLCTDTGFFRHLNERNGEALEAAARMVNSGASPKNVYNVMNSGKSLKTRILLGILLSRSESYFDGRLLLSHETLDDLNAFGIEYRDSDNFYKLLQSVEGVEAIIIIRQEHDDSCTVSLRSADKINVEQIAASFGGGGHKNASGLTMKGNVSFVKQLMLESFQKIFVS
jgi:phosphoesterase RecJ-like protein